MLWKRETMLSKCREKKKKVIIPFQVLIAQWFLCHNMTVSSKAEFWRNKRLSAKRTVATT